MNGLDFPSLQDAGAPPPPPLSRDRAMQQAEYPQYQQRRGPNRGSGFHRQQQQQHHQYHQRVARSPKIEDRGVKRARECPCAARLYLLEKNSIAAGNFVCSAILGVPSAFSAANEESGDATPDPKPRSVYMVWADTTLLELALEALRAARTWADKEFIAAKEKAEQRVLEAADPADEARKKTSVATSPAMTTKIDARREENAEPQLPHYRVELLCGYVDGQGQAVVHGLGTVELRQVIAGRTELVFPVRQGRGSVDYNAVATELGFGYGNPILFTCTRIK